MGWRKHRHLGWVRGKREKGVSKGFERGRGTREGVALTGPLDHLRLSLQRFCDRAVEQGRKGRRREKKKKELLHQSILLPIIRASVLLFD